MSKVYVSGKLVDKEQATVSVFDHGLQRLVRSEQSASSERST